MGDMGVPLSRFPQLGRGFQCILLFGGESYFRGGQTLLSKGMFTITKKSWSIWGLRALFKGTIEKSLWPWDSNQQPSKPHTITEAHTSPVL